MHVAVHALRRRDRAGEDVAEWVALFLAARAGGISLGHGIAVVASLGTMIAFQPAVLVGDCRVHRLGLPVAAILRVNQRMARLAVVGVDHVAARAARMAVIARLVVGPHEPGERIVEPGLVNIEHRDRDPRPSAGTACGLLQIGPPRLFELLDRTRGIGQARLGKAAALVSPAVLEHAEHIARWHHVPARQRIELGQRPTCGLARGQSPRRDNLRRLAIAGIGLTEHVVFQRHDPVVVGRTAPQHRAGGHQGPLGRLDGRHVARPARFAGDAVIAGVVEADELRAFAIEQRVAPLWIGRGREMPRPRIAREDVGLITRGGIVRMIARQFRLADHIGIAAVAIGAAQPHRRAYVHRRRFGLDVTGQAPGGLGRHVLDRLLVRSRRCGDEGVVARHRLLALACRDPAGAGQGGDEGKGTTPAHQ